MGQSVSVLKPHVDDLFEPVVWDALGAGLSDVRSGRLALRAIDTAG